MKSTMPQKRKEKQALNDSYVNRAWENPKASTALTSKTAFYKARKGVDNLAALEESLSKIPAYSIHRRLLKTYKKPAIILHETGNCYSSDLADFRSLSRFNSGYKWMLVSIDNFSRRLSVVLMKSKSAEETTKGLQTAMKELKYTPSSWAFDKGKEWDNGITKRFMKKNNITQYFMKTERKCSLAENIIKQLKIKIFKYFSLKSTKRYVELIPQLVNTHNSTIHSAHQFAPGSVTRSNQNQVFSNLYKRLILKPRKPPVYHLNQKVRLATHRYNFQKFYMPNFSKEIFLIAEIKNTFPVHTYRIKSLDNRLLESSYTKEELSRAE